MPRRIIPCILGYVLIAVACSDLAGPKENQRRYVGYSPAIKKNIPTITDWFQCASWDSGQSWDCVYDRTDYGAPDYWDNVDRFNTTAPCELNDFARYCDFNFDPARSPYNSPRTLARSSNVSDNLNFSIPTCPATASSPEVVKAWCAASPPNSTQLGRIQAALSRMHQLGGICDELATIGDALLSRQPPDLRIFPQSSFTKGGWAPLGGGSSGSQSYLLISNIATDNTYDFQHLGYSTDPNTGLNYPSTLQSTLAHELDHLKGNNHVTNPDGSQNPTRTPNQTACDDIT